MFVVQKGTPNSNTFIQFNVGHGECNFVFDKKHDFLLIDCGADAPARYSHIPLIIENYCIGMKSSFILTHYHSDHYSLFGSFSNPGNLFYRVYAPKIPIYQNYASSLLFEYIALSVISNYSYFNILPQIFNFGAHIIECDSNSIISEFNQKFDVFWPNFDEIEFTSRRDNVHYKRILNTLKNVESEYNISISNNEESFVNAIKSLRKGYEDLNEEKKNVIKDYLNEFREAFSAVADLHSLGFNSKYKRKDRYLILGDIPARILNHITISGKKDYNIIKASHHGTEFGTSLSNAHSDYVLISRNSKERPRITQIDPRYNMISNVVLNTEIDGHCIVI